MKKLEKKLEQKELLIRQQQNLLLKQTTVKSLQSSTSSSGAILQSNTNSQLRNIELNEIIQLNSTSLINTAGAHAPHTPTQVKGRVKDIERNLNFYRGNSSTTIGRTNLNKLLHSD